MFLSRPRQRRTSGDPWGQSAATDPQHASTPGAGFAGHGFAGQASARSLDDRGLDDRLRILIPALLAGGVSLAAFPVTAAADPSTDDLNQLRAEIQKEIAALKKQEAKLHQQFLDLDRRSQLLDKKSVLLDEQLRTLRATGIGSAGAAPVGVGAPGSTATITSSPTVAAPAPPSAIEVAQSPAAAPSSPGARRSTFAAACRGRSGADPGPFGGTATGPASRRDRAEFIECRRRPDPKGADRSRSVDRIRLLVAESARGQRLPNHPGHHLWQHLCQPGRAEHHHCGADRALWHNRPLGGQRQSPLYLQ